jgi:hypothetical protein
LYKSLISLVVKRDDLAHLMSQIQRPPHRATTTLASIRCQNCDSSPREDSGSGKWDFTHDVNDSEGTYPVGSEFAACCLDKEKNS